VSRGLCRQVYIWAVRAVHSSPSSPWGTCATLGCNMAKLNDEQRHALQVVAREPAGCAEVVLLAEGLSVGQLAALVLDGFAKRRPIVTNVSGREEIVVWMQITDAGRAALAD
jgi:hypothetical protein